MRPQTKILLNESRDLRTEIENHLLNSLKTKLGSKVTHSTDQYLYFTAASGEPHTVMIDAGNYVVSGNQPRGNTFRSADVDVVATHVQTL